MKIVNIPRFIFSLAIIICIISFLISMATNTVFSAEIPKYSEITVSAGDTIWSIAIDIGGNVEKNIYEIKKINNLKNSMIYVGQTLLVPIS